MKLRIWFAYKLLIGNWRRAIFAFLGVLGGVTALIMSLSLGAGGEKIIFNDLSAMSENRIMLGGADMNARDIEILESYPMIQYAVFPEARTIDGNNIFKGYSQKALSTLGLNQLKDREIILDKKQFPNKKQGDYIKVNIENREYNFFIKDMYEEKNPFELMRQGNRMIFSQSYYQRIFNRYIYRRVIISFAKEEDAEEYIPYILEKFNYRRLEKVRLLETPEIYKKIVKIQKIIKNILTILSIISLSIGGFGIMNLVASGIKARSGHIGIMRAIGMPRKEIKDIFLMEGVILSFLGTVIGIVVGIVLSIIFGKIISIIPEFNIIDIVLAIIVSVFLGVLMGIYPVSKIGKINIIEALRENE